VGESSFVAQNDRAALPGVTVQAGEDGIRFLLVSGKPLEEPVAWYGPIVMNTQEQLRQAFTELQEGKFLKETRRK
jgi:quercetin 2,3-dioxygenase